MKDVISYDVIIYTVYCNVYDVIIHTVYFSLYLVVYVIPDL